MTLRDPEVLDLLADDPTLLALADAVVATQQAQATARSNGWGARVLRAVRRRPGRTTLAFAAVAGVAAAALFVSSPWKTPPGFLEQVQAALTPSPGSILHKRVYSTDPACPDEVWIDQTPPHRYRVLTCMGGTISEFGMGGPPSDNPGDLPKTIRFVPPNTLDAAPVSFDFPFDNVNDLREAISAGRAHDEGTVQLDGRTVERIRMDPPSDCPDSNCQRKPAYAYVDPETFYPVQVECEDCGIIAAPDEPVVRRGMVMHWLTYELLPRTDENLTLTDILAQHPDATKLWVTPVLHLPVAMTVRAAKGAKSARVTFEVTATDDKGRGDFPVSCLPRSGSRFPLGETTVDCAAVGSNGKVATAGFTVTVKRRR
jgi:HYR domain